MQNLSIFENHVISMDIIKKRSFRRNGLTSNDCLPYEKSSKLNEGLNYPSPEEDFSAFLQTFVSLFPGL